MLLSSSDYGGAGRTHEVKRNFDSGRRQRRPWGTFNRFMRPSNSMSPRVKASKIAALSANENCPSRRAFAAACASASRRRSISARLSVARVIGVSSATFLTVVALELPVLTDHRTLPRPRHLNPPRRCTRPKPGGQAVPCRGAEVGRGRDPLASGIRRQTRSRASQPVRLSSSPGSEWLISAATSKCKSTRMRRNVP